MKRLYPGLAALVIVFILLLPCSLLRGQTVIEVMADQPDEITIEPVGDLFSSTGQSVIFGQNLSITGGSGHYSYLWMAGDREAGTGQYLELAYPILDSEFTLIVTDQNNCLATFLIVHDLPLSAEIVQDPYDEVLVYPVPATTTITISPPDNFDILFLRVYNNQGAMVMSREVNGETTFEIGFPAGVYIMSLLDSENLVVCHKKIIVL